MRKLLLDDTGFFDQVSQVQRGQRPIPARWRPLADAFQAYFGFAPLWIDVTWAESEYRTPPRYLFIDLIAELTTQYETLDPKPGTLEFPRGDLVLGWLDSEYHGRPPRLGWRRLTARRREGAFVGCQDFEAATKVHANKQAAQNHLQEFTSGLGLGDRLATVEVGYMDGLPRLFVRTTAQADELTASEAPDRWAMRWYELVKPYDRFGYLSPDDVRIVVDSEQNVEENHGGFYFYWEV